MLMNEHHHWALKVANRLDPLKVKVNQRRGLRHLKVSVSTAGDVTLNIPFGVSRAHAMKFLDEQRAWILSTLEKVKPVLTLTAYLNEHPSICALGKDYPLYLRESAKPGFVFDYEGAQVCLHTRAESSDEAVLKRSLRAFAEESIPLRVTDLARRRGLSFARVSVRDQRSRWGSCSERRTLSFNWRMILLPPALHDYLIWHELAHLVHLNHSPEFWHQLSIYDPLWEKHDAALTDYSGVLMRLGR